MGCGVGQHREDGSRRATAAASSEGIAFTHVTEALGLGGFRHVTGAVGDAWFPETMGAGAGFLDYDGDGWLDIVLVGGSTWWQQDIAAVTPVGSGAPSAEPPTLQLLGNPPALRLYRNEGDFFSEVTEEAGLGTIRAYGMGVAVADYDNDGDSDIFFTTLERNLLLRNDRGLDAEHSVVFTEVGREAGLGNQSEWSTSALFFDADLDGYADLYVGNYVEWSPEGDIWCTIDGETKTYCTPQTYTGLPGRFYHNEGDGTFSDWTERAGFLPAPGKTLGVAEWDIDEDGWPDLVVANDTQRDLLYINDRDGTFTERGIVSGLAFDENGRARAGMGIDIGVLDDTGQPSVVVGHFTDEMLGLYRRLAPGLFMDRAAASRTGHPSLPTLTFGLCLFDADSDGDLDLFLANGHIAPDVEAMEEGVSYRQHPQLFVNLGDGRFGEHAPPLVGPMVARAVATADVDRDGDVDLLVTENGGPVHLLRNDFQGGGFLRVRLEGRRSSRDALGAHVMAVVGTARMHRRVRSGSSYLAASDKALTFGLGGAEHVDTLMVRWPGGSVEHYTELPAGHEATIAEGLGLADLRPLGTPASAGQSLAPLVLAD